MKGSDDSSAIAITAASGAGSIQDIRDQMRGAYSNGFIGLTDKVLEQIVLPDAQAQVLYDMAQFMTFWAAVKMCEVRGQYPTRENLFKHYWPMQKSLKDDLPGQLREFAEMRAQVPGGNA